METPTRSGRQSPATTSRGCRCATCPGCAGKRRTTSSGCRIRPRTPGGTGRNCGDATDESSAAVLNLSGWYDDAYGVEGAATNFNGLRQARSGQGGARTHLVLGPWDHGAPSATDGRTGELDFGPNAAFDYDGWVLDFHDHYLRGIANRFSTAGPGPLFRHGRQRVARRRQLAASGGSRRDALFRFNAGAGVRRLSARLAGDRRIAQRLHCGPAAPGRGSSRLAGPA